MREKRQGLLTMTLRRLQRRAPTGFALLLLAACSSNTDATGNTPETGGLPDISNVVYVGGTTDEALLRLLDVTAKDVATQRAILDAPDLSAPLPQDSPGTFSFHLASQTARTPRPGANPRSPPGSKFQRPLRELMRFIAPERVAYAHGTPYNGTAYLLVIADANAKPALRVFTNQTSYTPDAGLWQSLALAAQPLSLSITSGFFEENNIPEDGGPFVGGTFAFRVQ